MERIDIVCKMLFRHIILANLILSSKGLLGKKRFAVPWDMFKFDEETQALRLDVDKEFLERIPAYQGD